MNRIGRTVTGVMVSALLLGPLAARVSALPPVSGPLPSCSTPCISVGDTSMLEGDSGTRAMTFPVTLSQPSTTKVTVQWRIVAGSATGASKAGTGVDFNNKNGAVGTITFAVSAKGITPVNHPVTLTIFGDTAAESDETLRVVLSNPTGGAHLSRPIGIGTIVDDDSGAAGVHVSVGDTAIVEGSAGTGRSLSFPISLSNAATTSFTLNYTVTGVTAQWGKTATVVGADYGGLVTGKLPYTISTKGITPVLKRVAIPVYADTRLEGDETLTFTISAASLPAGVTIDRTAGTGTIIDDDGVATSEPVPNSMAALGDSITRAYNACSPQFGECPAAVWATGTDPRVDSQYSRILAVNPAIAGHAFNDAVSGATMADLADQAAVAVGQGVDYVTIEMGGNDACKATEADMTPVATYENEFQQAITTIETGLPDARIFVASVPDIERLWYVGKDNPNARAIWAVAGICQSMLANPLSTDPADVDRRERVRQRVIDFNTALATVCAQYANCRTDDDVIFNQPFEIGDVSSIDYFHPSLAGQTGLAIASYGAGWNW